ncbi:sugar phosphate nucleotidyltransferase [Candidatus Pelagibacter sp. HIMB1709]|uniref:sugar phosphate nucleotidyltransferase n=1 Tax=Candidatus Pelagibacter sp. HIMB1709 TaxID=3413367 RepID=UPI003F84ECD8
MKINTALILCAGYGKRLNPLTLDAPKPLLEINNVTMLEKCIQLIKNLGIKKILINTFYLKDHFPKFLKNKNFDIDIEILEDGKEILDTGGGILNLINHSNENDFIIFNPDTLWAKEHLTEIEEMEEFYFSKNLNNILLLVNKNLSFDKNLKGDFNLENNLIDKELDKNYVFTGCQILSKKLFLNQTIKKFSISKIWYELIDTRNLYGYESKQNFYHLTNLEIFKKLKGL